MISQKYKDMLGQKSVIREMSAAGHKMGEEIGFDNVFDYSLGNPSVPAPKKVEDVIKKLLEETEPLSLHGYSEGHGILQVREKIAAYLAKTYDIPYTYEDIFMASGAAARWHMLSVRLYVRARRSYLLRFSRNTDRILKRQARF